MNPQMMEMAMKAMVSRLVTACTSITNPSNCSSSATPSANFFQTLSLLHTITFCTCTFQLSLTC